MVRKVVLCPARLRRLPRQFSWIGKPMVRDGHISHCDSEALALYLFLVTVADAQGLSYYADATLTQRLSFTASRLAQARQALIAAQLIAYQAPLYQVLDLAPSPVPLAARQKLTELRALLERAHD
jgi:hypothetical protein